VHTSGADVADQKMIGLEAAQSRQICAKGLRTNIRRGSDMPEAPVHVWFLDDAVSNEQSAKLIGVLSSDELQRARDYRQVRDRKRFTARRGMLRILIGYYLGCTPESVRFSTSEFGRPMLQWPNADLSFSVTQADRLALVAFAWDCRIGIDAERVTNKLDLFGIGREVFSVAEQEMVTASPPEVRCETFFKIWTRKEAFLKALGTGLSRKPRSFTTSDFPKAVSGRWCVFEQGIAITGWTQYDLVLEHDLKVALAVSLDTSRITVQSCALLV
jgi:4'-phosphopantetheinyl transferase